MTNEEFGEAVNDIINATLNVYIEAGLLLRDLRGHMEENMKVLSFKSISNGDEALKTLRGWRGFLARPELYESRKTRELKLPAPDDDDMDAPKDQPRMVRIPAAGDLLFAKLVFHDFPRPLHPYFIGGVLSEASLIGAESEPNRTFKFKTQYARLILEGMTADLWQEGGVTVRTDAKVDTGAGYKKSAGRRPPRLQLRLTQRPIHRHLFELNGIDAAQALATELLQQWKAAKPS
jgi:hypothetical protein